jgi:hypothetical protein
MNLSSWRRALWLLVVLVVLAPPVATLLLLPPTDLLARALRSIPAPQPVEIRPRLFVAYGALVATSTLGILYLYRGRSFVVYWIVSWSMLAASYTLNGRGYADVRIGSVMIGLSQLLAVWSAALLVLSVNELSKDEPHGWNVPVQAGRRQRRVVSCGAAGTAAADGALHRVCGVGRLERMGIAQVRAPREEDADHRRVHDERRARGDERHRRGGRHDDLPARLGGVVRQRPSRLQHRREHLHRARHAPTRVRGHDRRNPPYQPGTRVRQRTDQASGDYRPVDGLLQPALLRRGRQA